jgi:hypothetical protein
LLAKISSPILTRSKDPAAERTAVLLNAKCSSQRLLAEMPTFLLAGYDHLIESTNRHPPYTPAAWLSPTTTSSATTTAI